MGLRWASWSHAWSDFVPVSSPSSRWGSGASFLQPACIHLLRTHTQVFRPHHHFHRDQLYAGQTLLFSHSAGSISTRAALLFLRSYQRYTTAQKHSMCQLRFLFLSTLYKLTGWLASLKRLDTSRSLSHQTAEAFLILSPSWTRCVCDMVGHLVSP